MNLLRGIRSCHGDSNVGDEGEWVWQHCEVATSFPVVRTVELLLWVFQMISDQTRPVLLWDENWKDDFRNGETELGGWRMGAGQGLV